MRIDVLTLFPDFIAQCAGVGVVGRAAERGLISVHGWNPRDYATDNYRRVDERFVAREIDEELSIGDYVLSGGELAAAVVIDAVGRLQDGALNDAASAAQDSFEDGLLDCPHFTRSEGQGTDGVPPVLLSGDHAAIARWRRQQSLGRTWLRRPDLLARAALDRKDRELLTAFIAEWRAANPPGS